MTMTVVRGRARGAVAAVRKGTFTGEVWGDALLTPVDGIMANTVMFTPCARTHWHRHDGGQLIQVTAGEGWIAERGGEPVRILLGDTVWSPPGTEHWHGAADGAILVHTAITLGHTEWLEEVTDAEFALWDATGRS